LGEQITGSETINHILGYEEGITLIALTTACQIDQRIVVSQYPLA